MKYPLSFNSWNKKEEKEILKVLKSKNYTMGKNVKDFEKRFAKKFGSNYAVMVNSGSSANLLILSALKYFRGVIKKKINKNSNIIAPAVGWSTSYFPINQMGFKINFVDVNIKTLNLEISQVEKVIDKDTVAIFAINLLGNPCNFKKLKEISKKHNLILIEDNCESLAAKYRKRYTGTFGIMASHSFFFAHHIQTMEGGAILTDNKDISDFLKSLRAHGWCRDLPKKNKLYKFRNDNFVDKFKFITPGYCVRPLEMEAAVGNIQLNKLNNFINIRRNNANIFTKLFGNKNWCEIQKEEVSARSSWYGFNILLKGKLKGKRNKIVKKLKKNHIEVRPTMTGNFLNNPVIKKMNYIKKYNLKNAEYIDKNGFFLGNYPKDLSKELNYAYKIISNELN
tara:strand:+ start:119 stop:1303 length:1185 start_codon:yes stop_codon:yes gene_type:complete